MAKVSQSFVDETLWPEYQALDQALREHLEAVALQIISEAVSPDTSDPVERVGLPPGA